MAVLKNYNAEAVAKLKGIIDIYNLRDKIVVARKWPRKPKPPYSQLQADAMRAFSLAKGLIKHFSLHITAAWKKWNSGKREQWPDEVAAITMRYWGKTRSFPVFATDYEIVETETTWSCKWWLLQAYIDPDRAFEYSTVSGIVLKKSDIAQYKSPYFFSLYDDDGLRLVAPMILLPL